jgi:hypothetical protein
MKIDSNISRYCELVVEINSLTKVLQKEEHNFYYGGHDFEDVYYVQIQEIIDLQIELKELLKTIVNS